MALRAESTVTQTVEVRNMYSTRSRTAPKRRAPSILNRRLDCFACSGMDGEGWRKGATAQALFIRRYHGLSSPAHTVLMHSYEIRPRKDKRGFDLISDALPFGRLWYTEIPHAIGYAKFRS
jgi:hypothetical protein